MSRRTSTTRAYKSRRASPAAGGERARAQHSRQVSGTDRPMGDRWTMHGHGLEGKEETNRQQVRGDPKGWGWGQGGGHEGPPATAKAGARGVRRTPSSTCLRPDGDATTSEEHRLEDRPESLRLFLGLLRHPPKKVGRRCWRPRRRAPSSPPRRAVTQPRCPQSAELGRRRETDAHLPAPLPQLLGIPPLIQPGRPLPVPSSWSLSAPNFPPPHEELSSQDQAGAGPRPDCPAPPPSPAPPPPRSRKCLSAGTSLTSQGFDVKGRVPVR